jgi:ATP-dependent HslUV protease ATP-binding subunit HslU
VSISVPSSSTEGGPGRREDLTPRQVVAELDRHVIGQDRAKRAVAVALRNRIRRRHLPEELAAEIVPKNIIMMGPTGVGKTEIARRLARLVGSPFLKVEASKFTEVGYVGRDCESMVRDLTEVAMDLVRQERRSAVRDQARRAAEERLLDLLRTGRPAALDPQERVREAEELKRELEEGKLEDREVELEVRDSATPAFSIFSGHGMEEMNVRLGEMMPGMFGNRTRQRRMSVPEAWEYLQREEEERLVDDESVAGEAIRRVEQSGILFIDEIDKVAGREGRGGSGPDVSREGVQRDLLPIVEGTIVNTKHGLVRTDHILFLAAGAFHVSRPSDLIPELQGRFPIRVELDSLGASEFVRILTEPAGSLVAQYTALLAADGLELEFTEGAIRAIAEMAVRVNDATENIGARRLHTVMERLLEELSFEAPDRPPGRVVVDESLVASRLADVVEDRDLSRYVL